MKSKHKIEWIDARESIVVAIRVGNVRSSMERNTSIDPLNMSGSKVLLRISWVRLGFSLASIGINHVTLHAISAAKFCHRRKTGCRSANLLRHSLRLHYATNLKLSLAMPNRCVLRAQLNYSCENNYHDCVAVAISHTITRSLWAAIYWYGLNGERSWPAGRANRRRHSVCQWCEAKIIFIKFWSETKFVARKSYWINVGHT